MTWFRTPSVRRTALLSAGLMLFLLGSNYCLVGAVMGTDVMACMPSGRAQPLAHAVPGGMDDGARVPSCHGRPAGDDEETAASGAAPCCIAVAPVVTPKVTVAEPSTFTVIPVEIESDLAAVELHVVGTLLRAPPGESPPTRLTLAPYSSRAPPLA